MEKEKQLLSNFNFGLEVLLTKQEIEESNLLNKPVEKKSEVFLSTKIISTTRCGFADSGNFMYLANYSKKHKFRVIVRIHSIHDRGQQGQIDKTIDINILSKISLGCSNTGGPVGSITRYTFEIIRETQL